MKIFMQCCWTIKNGGKMDVGSTKGEACVCFVCTKSWDKLCSAYCCAANPSACMEDNIFKLIIVLTAITHVLSSEGLFCCISTVFYVQICGSNILIFLTAWYGTSFARQPLSLRFQHHRSWINYLPNSLIFQLPKQIWCPKQRDLHT